MNKIVRLLLIVCAVVGLQIAKAQPKEFVTFSYEAKKKTDNTYDVVITATVAKGWHIYSQNSGADGPVPTSFKFNKNPLISFEGKTAEAGKMVKFFDKNFNTNVLYYSDKVVFTQLVKVKGKAKTTVTGSLEYMLCNDEKCLPPKTVNFSVKI